MNKQVALYRSRKARHMLASPTSYKADPEIELKLSPIEAERCSLFWSFHLLPLPGVQRLGTFSISKMIAKILQQKNYYKVPALPVSLLAAWLSLSGSHLKGDFLKSTNFHFRLTFTIRIPLDRQLPANRQTTGSGSGSGAACDYDPWTQV